MCPQVSFVARRLKMGSVAVVCLLLVLLGGILPAAALPAPYGSQVDTVRAAKQGGTARDYTIEGEVVTVWDKAFLMRDGSGEVVVDTSPNTTRALNIKGRMGAQVVGHMVGNVFKPMVISGETGVLATYTGHDNLPPLSEKEIRRNTTNHRFTPALVQQAIEEERSKSSATKDAGNGQ